jgi:hypothetical protein
MQAILLTFFAACEVLRAKHLLTRNRAGVGETARKLGTEGKVAQHPRGSSLQADRENHPFAECNPIPGQALARTGRPPAPMIS